MTDSNPVRGNQPGRRGPHPAKRLSSVAVRNLGEGRHADGNGLYLEVDASGARRWHLRTVVHGRRRTVCIGSAQLVGLADARDIAARLRRVAREGGDPFAERDKDKAPRAMSFADAARKVHAEQILPHARNQKAGAQWLTTLETYAFPTIGTKPVDTVEQADVLRILAPIWTTKAETAKRVRQRLRTVLSWAKTAGLRQGDNPVDGIEQGLPRVRQKVEHFAALPWRELPVLMSRIAEVEGMGALALRFTILTAARSGETRGATWGEIDLEGRVWSIPAERMKSGREHRVPLSDAALAILEHVRPLAGSPDDVIFPSARGKPLSDMTLAAVLKRLEVPATVHGMRSCFRDWAEETTAFPHEVKEAALAHTLKDKVERAYRRSDLFDRRVEMMDQWSRFATGGTGEVVPLRAAT